MEGVVPEAPSVWQQITEMTTNVRKAVGSVVATTAGLPLGVAEAGINLAANISAMPATFVGYPLAKGINKARTKMHKVLSGPKVDREYQQAA
ncbi:MAG: hypothetical protein WCS85_03780 [Candidatus Peribacteraceae bacterium]